MVVTGQHYLPTHVGLASGVTLGLAISVGGLAAPVLVKLADFSGNVCNRRYCRYSGLMAFFLPRASTEVQ